MQVYVNSKKRLRRCADIFGSDPFSSFAEMLTNRGKKSTPLTRIFQVYASVQQSTDLA